MTCDEVGVEVSQERVPDLETQRPGVLQVLTHISLRIDHRRVPCLFVADKIRRVRKASKVILFENQSRHLPTQRTAAAQ